MKNIFFILCLGISISTFSQSINEIDSLSFQLCDDLKSLDNIEDDTERIAALYSRKFGPILRKVNADKAEQVGQQLYYRLQRNCVEFRNLLDKLEPPKEKASRAEVKPTSKISKKELKKFKKIKKFRYFEVNGDTTRVELTKDKWIDNFADSTYSKLEYKWINKYEFELTFIESNNEMRSNFSVKGDQFIYRIIEKKTDHYVMSVQIKEQEVYEIFKFYIDK